MNNYETVFIVTPVLSEAQIAEVADKFRGVITENGGQIVNFENWGLKKLAYSIQNKTTGFYFLAEFTGEGSIVEKLETQYRRDERIIRFLTFKQDKYAVEYSEKRRAKLANKNKEEYVHKLPLKIGKNMSITRTASSLKSSSTSRARFCLAA